MLDLTNTLTLWLFANSAAIIAIAYWLHQTDRQAETHIIDMQEFMDRVSPLTTAHKDRAETTETQLKEVYESYTAELRGLNKTIQFQHDSATDSLLKTREDLYQLKERVDEMEALLSTVEQRTSKLVLPALNTTGRLDQMDSRMQRLEGKVLSAAEIRMARLESRAKSADSS